MKSFNSVVLALLLLVLMTGCITRTVRQRHNELCTNLAIVTTAIGVLRTANATVGDMKQVTAQAGEALRNMQLFARDVPEVDIQDLETAFKDLEKSVNEIPDQSTANQAVALISSKAMTLESAVNRTKSGLRCPQ